MIYNFLLHSSPWILVEALFLGIGLGMLTSYWLCKYENGGRK
jgi:hypothetical protein